MFNMQGLDYNTDNETVYKAYEDRYMVKISVKFLDHPVMLRMEIRTSSLLHAHKGKKYMA